jgi:myo-inositol 2-dehydrogenase/D-chiro-inositol 1-dehydrogenase
VHINNSRRCSYGFDQRIEVFGERGLLQTTNHRDKNLVRWDALRTEARVPLKHFFLERYDASFYNALDEFYDAVITARRPSSTQEDGRAALAIALACTQSAKENRPVIPDYGSC